MAASAASLQMHLQHSPRKKNFGYEETIRLLELWTHYTNGGTHPELGKGHRTGRLWLVISERMKAMNYNRGPEECKVRVGNLRAKYTKLKRGYLAGDFPQIGARGKWTQIVGLNGILSSGRPLEESSSSLSLSTLSFTFFVFYWNDLLSSTHSVELSPPFSNALHFSLSSSKAVRMPNPCGLFLSV